MNAWPSPTPQSGHFHAVRFYENATALGRIVAEFLGEGLAQGSAGLLIGAPDHISTIEEALYRRGFDVARLKREGDLTVADAEATLRAFMIDGMPDGHLFRATMAPILDGIAVSRQSGVIRAYGEMVDVLWRAGQNVAAVKLEMLWNELARSHDFSLLCGYSMGNFYKSASIDEICEHHTHVVSADGDYGRVI